MMQRIRCALGLHSWQRSKFVALCDTEAMIWCPHCGKCKA